MLLECTSPIPLCTLCLDPFSWWLMLPIKSLTASSVTAKASMHPDFFFKRFVCLFQVSEREYKSEE